MSPRVLLSVVVLLLCCLVRGRYCAGVAVPGLLKGVRCGPRDCAPTEYCNDSSFICEKCEKVCGDTHNRDEFKCKEVCQQYLQIKMFETLNMSYGDLRNEVLKNHENVKNDIQHLYYTGTANLILTTLLLVCLFVFMLIRICRWKKKRNINVAWIRTKIFSRKKAENQQVGQGVSVTNASGKLDLRLEMPDSALGSVVTAPSTASTGISTTHRRPTEDSPLDYAYDNPAMATTPSPNHRNGKPPHESQL